LTTYLWGKPLAPSECEGNSGRGQNSPVDKWSEKTSPGAQAAVGGRGTEEKASAFIANDPAASTLECTRSRFPAIIFLLALPDIGVISPIASISSICGSGDSV